MLRMCCRSSRGVVFSSPHLLSLKTSQPTVRYLSSGGGGAAKILGTTLAITTGAIGGVVVYSTVDPDFRKTVEENIPGSTSLVGLLLGDQNASIHMEKEVAVSAEAAKTVEEEALAAKAAMIVAEEAEEARRTAADEAAAVESKIIAEEQLIAAQEAAAAAEESKAAEEAAEEVRKTLETARIAEEKASEAVKIAADEAAAAELTRIAEEEAVAAEAEKVAAVEAAAAEQAMIAEEEVRRALETARIEEEEAAEAVKIAADEAAAAELTRIAEEEAVAAEAEKVAAVEAAAAEKAMIAEKEAADEVRKALETARLAEEEAAETAKVAPVEAEAADKAMIAAETAKVAPVEAEAADKAIIAAEEEAVKIAADDAAAAEAIRVSEEAAAEALKVEEQAAAESNEAIIAAEELRLALDATSADEEVAEAASIASEESFTPGAVRLAEDEASKTAENVKVDLVDTKDTSGSETESSLANEDTAENITEEAETVSVIDLAKKSTETEEAATEVEAVDKATVASETTKIIPEEEAHTITGYVVEAIISEGEETENSSISAQEDITTETELQTPEKLNHFPALKDSEILNGAKDVVLVDMCNYIEEIAACVVSDYEASSDAVMAHTNLLQNMLDSDQTPSDDTVWDEMFITARAKTEAAKAAETREQEALEAITKAVDLITAEKKDETVTSNSELMVAEETANRAIFMMEQAKAKNAALRSEATVMEECGELLKVGREQFHKEMSSIMPDVKLGEKNGTLTEFELNMFITHAYKKVLYLQQEVAKQQTFEQERFTKALEKQKLEIEILALEEMDAELYRQGKELRSEHEMMMAAIREKAEGELRDHLRRQAGAHTDHVTDVLTVQEAELARHHKHEMDEHLDTLNSKHVNSIASLSGTVSGVTEALESRAASDAASLSAQKLWVACTALNSAVNMGRMDATDWEEKLQPLHKEVEQVKMAAGEEDKFVEIVLASISPVALERGVYTEDRLKERFNLVEKMARRVAGIGEDGGSLLAFGLSFLQSLLVIDLTNRTEIENLKDKDFGAVPAIDLVRLAKYSLDEGNIARAVQMLVQLKGESGRVVKDWVAEATLMLETKQAVEAILVHSQASSCKNMPDV